MFAYDIISPKSSFNSDFQCDKIRTKAYDTEASNEERLIACIVDIVIVILISVVSLLTAMPISILYVLMYEPGKRVMNLQVVARNDTTQQLSFYKKCKRGMCKFILLPFVLCHVMSYYLLDHSHQYHSIVDRICDTKVVQKA